MAGEYTPPTHTVIIPCYLCGAEGGRATGVWQGAARDTLSAEAERKAQAAGFRFLPRRGHRPPMSLCPGCVADVAALRVGDG